MSRRPWLLLGNPQNRRVAGFLDALREAGEEVRGVVAWADVARSVDALAAFPDEELWFRIDAAGEDDAVHRILLRRGDPEHEPPSWAYGEIVAPRRLHEGLLAVLADLDGLLRERPRWVCTTSPRAIARAFDKRRCHAEHRAAGVAVPEALAHAVTWDDLARQVNARGWDRIFVKLNSGSSASCLALVAMRPRPYAMTTVYRAADGRRFNSLRLRRIAGEAFEDLVGFLMEQDSHVERAVPKARIDGAFFDCRVVVVAGEPRFVVPRLSPHPITNLHLGGRRGDVDRVRAMVPRRVWDDAMDDCTRVASLQGALQVGVDVMFDSDVGGHHIVEVNAFGDLLPNVVVDGQTVYAAQIAQIDRWHASRA